jgi:hypothetical protein
MAYPLYSFAMVGQLTTPPYQTVNWLVYGTADMTGLYSGYYGQLQNIAVASQQQITPPTNPQAVNAQLLQNIPVASVPPTPVAGQSLVATTQPDGSIQWVPGLAVGGITRMTLTLTLAQLQALGNTLVATDTWVATVTVGTFPANARLVNPVPEFIVNQAFAASGLSSVVVELGTMALEGLLGQLNPITNTVGNYAFTGGGNTYTSWGGQTIVLELIMYGADFNALTAGSCTVNVLYAIVP